VSGSQYGFNDREPTSLGRRFSFLTLRAPLIETRGVMIEWAVCQAPLGQLELA